MVTDALIPLAAVFAGFHATSKREVLEFLSREAAGRTGQAVTAILEALLMREHLGSTGVGAGIAIPHARLPGLERVCAVFLRLDCPIDFQAVDEHPVDLVFLLLSPAADGADHLRALSQISRLMRDPKLCTALRRTTDPAALQALLTAHLTPATI